MSVRSRPSATAIGFLAVLSWATLALFTVGSGEVPPFQLCALCFLVGGLMGLGPILRAGRAVWRQPAKVWLLGVGGIFGYHFFYFTALRGAPPAEANLIANLWPLLIVLFAGMLPGERLGLLHLLGAALGLSGVALLVSKDGSLAFDARYAAGYGAALVCALIWSSYSVLSRLVANVPTALVAAFCLIAAVLSAGAHLALETTRWPSGALEWASVAALGLGPVGGAFYVWDIGMKHGDIQLLGAASYAGPLIATLLLIAVGIAAPTPTLLTAAALIVGGASIAAYGSARRVAV